MTIREPAHGSYRYPVPMNEDACQARTWLARSRLGSVRSSTPTAGISRQPKADDKCRLAQTRREPVCKVGWLVG